MLLWIVLGVGVWVVVSVGVALLVGGVVARRDRQVCAPDVLPPAGAVPVPRTGRDLTGGAGRSVRAPRR